MTIWGTGTVRREFLHVDDCADALVFLMQSYSANEHVNVGSGEDLTILELAELVCDVVGLQGQDRHRYDQAGWHAAQADERRAPAAARVEAKDPAAPGNRADLPLVSGKPTPDLMPRAQAGPSAK